MENNLKERNDLIRRGDAFTRFQKQYIDTQEGTDHVAIRINIGITKCIHAMQDIPAVDAVEVRHARPVKFYSDPYTDRLFTTCSACDGKIGPKDKWCKHCGARMDGEDGDT